MQSPDQLTLLVFKDNLVARTFQLPLKWLTRFGWLLTIQTWIAQNTNYGTFADSIERSLFGEDMLEDGSSSAMPKSSLPKIIRAPEFAGLGPWHNSEPFTMESLRGKVVLVDFWTYSCINCIRTLPYIQGYWDKFQDQPFVLIGVHSPEFVFEKDQQNVKDAIERHGLTYPVAQDNDFETWRLFANRYWPAKYLIDAEGYVRYTHFGEGAYDETDEAIQSLLAEIGADVEDMPVTENPETRRRDLTPELYIGERSWPTFAKATAGKPAEPDDLVHLYEPPADLPLHAYSLGGEWQLVEGEHQVLRSAEGELRLKFLGGEANLVLGLADGAAPVAVEVAIDGKKAQTFKVDRHDLFELFKGEYGEHELTLRFMGAGVEAYAFTFGS
jgi:thiol-disulfide isomerase/thioredoxin